MRIQGPKNNPIAERPAGERPADAAPAAPSGAPQPSSVVAIGAAAAQAVRSEGTVDAAVTHKLERIRALLATGEYPVDLDALATSIVDDESNRGTGPGPDRAR